MLQMFVSGVVSSGHTDFIKIFLNITKTALLYSFQLDKQYKV